MVQRQEIVSRDASPYSKPDYSNYTPTHQRNEGTGRPPIVNNPQIEKTPTVAKQLSYQNLNLNVARESQIPVETEIPLNSRRSSYASEFQNRLGPMHTEDLKIH